MKYGKLLIFILGSLILLFFASKTSAASTYVLPYPSYMPGSFFYKPSLVIDSLKKYWYFGDFSQFEYNRKLSDKYLVEAKTLFEYNQYLLALKALEKSDQYFESLSSILKSASAKGKNSSQKKEVLKKQTTKHIEVLKNLLQTTPEKFNWNPEKSKPIELYIHSKLNHSMDIRKHI